MTRRRLMLGSFSDSDKEREKNDHCQHQPQPCHDSSNSPNPNSNIQQPVPISDDAFFDVSDNFSPQSFPSESAHPTHHSPAVTESSGCQVYDFLERIGLKLKKEWLDSCLDELARLGSEVGVTEKAKICFQRFLLSDMNYCGGGVLPENVDSLHLVDLAGPFVLQIDEIVNISSPLRGRYQEVPSGAKRCLKLSLTDGVQRIFGMEYRPINDVNVLYSSGLKVVLCNAHIRRGLLLLMPESLVVLGGMVEELDAAHRRLVDEVNKPPRGRRSGAEVVPLAARAMLAAWPIDFLDCTRNSNSSANILGQTNGSVSILQPTNIPINVSRPVGTLLEEDTDPTSMECARTENVSAHPSGISIDGAAADEHGNAISENERVQMVEDSENPPLLHGDQEIPFTYLASLSAKWAALKDKPYVTGMVKCFLTGVKGFQYKNRTTYELQVYVDDGSLISEILIDHNVVQKEIGLSPGDVTAALCSSESSIVVSMKENLRRFQKFLFNFEGTMTVEMNRTSSIPVALEMNQGCSTSDAWLLLKRLDT